MSKKRRKLRLNPDDRIVSKLLAGTAHVVKVTSIKDKLEVRIETDTGDRFETWSLYDTSVAWRRGDYMVLRGALPTGHQGLTL